MTDNSVLAKGDPLTKDGQSRVQTSPGEKNPDLIPTTAAV
jgi:hypothetical protein